MGQAAVDCGEVWVNENQLNMKISEKAKRSAPGGGNQKIDGGAWSGSGAKGVWGKDSKGDWKGGFDNGWGVYEGFGKGGKGFDGWGKNGKGNWNDGFDDGWNCYDGSGKGGKGFYGCWDGDYGYSWEGHGGYSGAKGKDYGCKGAFPYAPGFKGKGKGKDNN